MANKKKLYEMLRADGAKLKAMNFYTIEQLRDIYFDRFGVEYTVSGSNETSETADTEIRTLVFDRGGWCNELKTSYAMGIYRPATVEEYAILKQYAVEVL